MLRQTPHYAEKEVCLEEECPEGDRQEILLVPVFLEWFLRERKRKFLQVSAGYEQKQLLGCATYHTFNAHRETHRFHTISEEKNMQW
ncbi:uncharacterized protein LOC119160104 isoform X3 [Rhipicephalus microplus]|uniref:uncharacterized protein LOC119160104 isoform X3 n=1 Tax=Rhipicephalus microplus TaxID=6941 RepID=UPI003F6B25F3